MLQLIVTVKSLCNKHIKLGTTEKNLFHKITAYYNVQYFLNLYYIEIPLTTNNF